MNTILSTVMFGTLQIDINNKSPINTVFTRLIVVTIISFGAKFCHDYLRCIIIRDVQLNFKLLLRIILSNYKLCNATSLTLLQYVAQIFYNRHT